MNYYVYSLMTGSGPLHDHSDNHLLIREDISSIVPENHPYRLKYLSKNPTGTVFSLVTGGTDPSLINTADCSAIRRYSTIHRLRGTFVSRAWKTRTDWSRK